MLNLVWNNRLSLNNRQQGDLVGFSMKNKTLHKSSDKDMLTKMNYFSVAVNKNDNVKCFLSSAVIKNPF